MAKKLYRSRENRIIGGVLGGVGEYFNIDPILPRLMFTLITLATGIVPALIVYIVAVIVIPEVVVAAPKHEPVHAEAKDVTEENVVKSSDAEKDSSAV